MIQPDFLLGLLSQDAQIRQAGEQQLNALILQNTPQAIAFLVSNLTHQNDEVAGLAAIILRSQIILKVDLDQNTQWNLKQSLQNSLSQVLQRKTLLKKITDCLISGIIKQGWVQDVQQLVLQLLSQQDSINQFLGYYILEQEPKLAGNVNIFKQGLESQEVVIRTIGIKSALQYIKQNFDDIQLAEMQNVHNLAQSIIQSINGLLQFQWVSVQQYQDSLRGIFQGLSQNIQDQIDVWEQKSGDLIRISANVIQTCLSQNINLDIDTELTQMLQNALQIQNDVLSSFGYQIKNVSLQSIVDIFNTNFEILKFQEFSSNEQMWENFEESGIKGMQQISRETLQLFSECAGATNTQGYIQQILPNYLNSQNEACKQAAIQAIGLLGDDFSEIEPEALMKILIPHISLQLSKRSAYSMLICLQDLIKIY